MSTRLFHAVVVAGSSLAGAATLGSLGTFLPACDNGSTKVIDMASWPDIGIPPPLDMAMSWPDIGVPPDMAKSWPDIGMPPDMAM